MTRITRCERGCGSERGVGVSVLCESLVRWMCESGVRRWCEVLVSGWCELWCERGEGEGVRCVTGRYQGMRCSKEVEP